MKRNNPCEFPEKLFEALVNHELMNIFLKKNKRVILWSPSQSKEASLGYDALFENGSKKLIAIQYKIPVYRYTQKHKGCLKFKLHKNGSNECKQHELLCDLISKRIVDEVVYCAPLFTSVRKLNNCVGSGTLTSPKNISQIIPSALSSIIGNHHCVYEKGKATFFCNEKTPAETIDMEDLFLVAPEHMQVDSETRKQSFKKFVDDNPVEMAGVMFYSIN